MSTTSASHDPQRDDEAVDRVVRCIHGDLARRMSSLEVFAAAEGHQIEMRNAELPQSGRSSNMQPAVSSALVDRTALVVLNDSRLRNITMRLCGETPWVTDLDRAEQVIGALLRERPSLLLLEHAPPAADGLAICRRIRQIDDAYAREVPVVLVAGWEDIGAGDEAGVSDWLTTPFSSQYARTRVRA